MLLGILMWKIKALALTVQRFITKLKFQTDLQNDEMAEWETGQKQCAPDLQPNVFSKMISLYFFIIFENRTLSVDFYAKIINNLTITLYIF